MDAIFNVLKPPQMTSHDVIGFLRRMLNTKKIGHGGTLDPDAAGVLPVFAGSATRLLEFAVEGRKEYIAEFTLGAQTVTGDDSGEVVKTMPVPAFGKQELEAVLAQPASSCSCRRCIRQSKSTAKSCISWHVRA